jgi:cytochrome c peroxidase
LHAYLSELPPPSYPFPIDADKAAAGKTLFDAHCARCHASELTGRPLPLAEVGTDRGRLDSWNKGAAIKANQVVKEMGLERRGLVEEDLQGYVAAFLDGIWLKAPYLHNGSVPTLRDLLEPAARRPQVFWRGYDVYDQRRVGFVTDTPEARRVGTRLDTTSKAGSNQGHEFGTGLSAAEKETLLEYLKTL